MNKDELINLLHDPDVCREIFSIIKNGGKPSIPSAPAASSPGNDRLAAIREKLKSAAQNNPSEGAKSYTPNKNIISALKTNLEKTKNSLSKGEPSEETMNASKPSAPKGGSFSDKLEFLRNHVQKTAAESANTEKDSVHNAVETEKYTFTIERKCPICEKKTRVTKYKTRLVAETTDVDLCVHYKGFDPYLYKVWACEHCGFAAEERRFLKPMPGKTVEKLLEFLNSSHLAMPYTEERDPETALSYCEMAILFNELSDTSPGRRAGLYLNMAWICRYEGESEKEREAMQKAAELYEKSLESEAYPVDSMSDTTATYLTGALYFMLNDYEKAARYLSYIISNQGLRESAPKTYEKARDLWQEIKSAKNK